MTNNEIDELIQDCPTLFHMAEEGAWSSISDVGLLSTSALLDRYGVNGDEREAIESCHRPDSVDIRVGNRLVARVRDQKPMSDGGLVRALPRHISPRAWYEMLNSKVFFWLTAERLSRLIEARAYRTKAHDILEIDTHRLVNAYRDSIWLCPINSGCTKPFPWPRDESAFQRMADYPYSAWKAKRRAGERVVELAIDYAVPDIGQFTKRVTRRVGADELEVLWEA